MKINLTTKCYITPSVHITDINLHEELFSSTITVKPGEEGNQEEAEVHAREFLEEERDVWSEGLW